MANGKKMLDRMEFEEQLEHMSDRDLAKFTARQVFDLCNQYQNQESRIAVLEGRDRKAFSVTGGIGAVVGATIGALVDWAVRRGG